VAYRVDFRAVRNGYWAGAGATGATTTSSGSESGTLKVRPVSRSRTDRRAGGGTANSTVARTKSILDAVQTQYTTLSAKLGSADRAKLREHLDMIRQMEMSLTVPTGGGGTTCTVPPMPAASGKVTGSMSSSTGVIVTETDIPQKGKAMTDLLVASLACDVTRVATMQWGDSEAKFILNFDPLNMPDHHHAYQHEKGFQPDALFKIYQWYATNFAYLLLAFLCVLLHPSTGGPGPVTPRPRSARLLP